MNNPQTPQPVPASGAPVPSTESDGALPAKARRRASSPKACAVPDPGGMDGAGSPPGGAAPSDRAADRAAGRGTRAGPKRPQRKRPKQRQQNRTRGKEAANPAEAPAESSEHFDAVMNHLEESGLRRRTAPNELMPYAAFADTDFSRFEHEKIIQIMNVLHFPPELDRAGRDARIVQAIDQFQGLEPRDAAESMLDLQMIATHNAALELMRVAMLPHQSIDGCDRLLARSERLMKLFVTQLLARDKYRGKGQQTIRVEKVQVAPGGKAVFGNDNSAAPLAEATAPAPPALRALEAPREDTVPLPPQQVLPPKVPR